VIDSKNTPIDTMFNSTNLMQSGNPNGEISVTPPETLVRYDAPLFAGIEPSGERPFNPPKSQNQETNGKIDDMLNSMIPPR
jgi:hypothetical protein